MNMEEVVRKKIIIKEILNDLKNGLTRFASDDFGHGSIEEKYSLSIGEVVELFKYPKLKKRETKKWGLGISFDIIDDIEDEKMTGEEMITTTIENVNRAIVDIEDKL